MAEKKSLLKEMKESFFVHPVAAHFSNGLIPVAVLYLLLTLPSSDPFFEHTVEHLIIIVLFAIPVSFFSGIHDWTVNYKRAKTPVFMNKIRLSFVLFGLVAFAVAIRLTVPDVMYRNDWLHWVYIVLLLAMMPVVTLLGHYGGKLAGAAKMAAARRKK
ncbi:MULTISPECIES: hypothetical protein [Prosthecochloris]|uniref:DUF2231 domain-containing protein n=1 Tax=Prosthecochloris marina TaxID=2017681 RepID=A0A317T350_9CHLB|nr:MULTISPECIES: hypothetical protein [Prosthecochloris]PWW81138.1 hypothetical protein CR164_12065 [Prosthecochloris marina]UZJ37689.1 hypothetical protein OO005_00315 [Prosthecochloris sp. SCSIO W1103]UZJ39508.1 hypothetical protein OO185_06140 [Prosthecochloris sp. SCSIO W1102]